MPVFSMQTLWLALAIIFGIVEAATFGLTSIWFAVGALAGMLCAALHAPFWLQILVFIVVSAVTLWLTRDFAKNHFNAQRHPTNADRIIGTDALVLETIDNAHATGLILAGGVRWTARTEDGSVAPKDSMVTVQSIDGVKAIVLPKTSDK